MGLSACGSVKDLADQIQENIMPADPIDPPALLSEIKPTITPKILWKASMPDEEVKANLFSLFLLTALLVNLKLLLESLSGKLKPEKQFPLVLELAQITYYLA